jgi:hypothetical protein
MIIIRVWNSKRGPWAPFAIQLGGAAGKTLHLALWITQPKEGTAEARNSPNSYPPDTQPAALPGLALIFLGFLQPGTLLLRMGWAAVVAKDKQRGRPPDTRNGCPLDRG